jgi:hypothetical protein
VLPVCLPFKDHSVSPWRIMKTRGVIFLSAMVVCVLWDWVRILRVNG